MKSENIENKCIEILEAGTEIRFRLNKIPELLPDHILIKVEYSSINYKDYLTITKRDGFLRKYPHIPGIDAAGIVQESRSVNYKKGDRVAVVATPMGLIRNGGWASYVTIPDEWAILIPNHISTKSIMAIGTAGLSAAIAVNEILQNIEPKTAKPILVTGGSGGVAMLAINLLIKSGYDVVASTGNLDANSYLTSLGVSKVIGRIRKSNSDIFSILPERWSGCIDTIGGDGLEVISKSLIQKGIVTVIGMTAGSRTQMNLMPFILKGIRLVGINAEQLSSQEKLEVISKFFTKECLVEVDKFIEMRNFEELPHILKDYESNQRFGRVVIKMI